MGRKSKFISKLTEEEKKSLKKGYTHGASPLYRRKCHSILLSHSGKSTKELSDFFGVTKQSILFWFKAWEQKGIKGLELQPGRGRKPKLNIKDDKQVKIVKTLIENEPKNLFKVTAQIKAELDINLSKKTLKRFLKNLSTSGSDLKSV